MVQKKISSFKAFHKLVPQIVKEISKDEALAIRATVNPLLAIEELGYHLTPSVKRHVELLLRFPPASRKRLKALESEIHKLAGEKFDPDSDRETDRILFEKLKLTRPASVMNTVRADMIRQGAQFVQGKRPAWTETLQLQENQHEIVKPLLEYRKLMAERPGFAPPSLYEQLKTGRRKLPISRIRIELPEHTGEYGDA